MVKLIIVASKTIFVTKYEKFRNKALCKQVYKGYEFSYDLSRFLAFL